MANHKARGPRIFHDLRRRPPTRVPRARILIICEGIKTEVGYFTELKRQERNSLVEIEVDPEGGVPKTLVERAAARKKEADRASRRQEDENLKFDEVWCVFDVDEHPHLPDAKQQARDNGIHLAISNPCFELWALLHFAEQTAYIHRHDVATKLKSYLPRYKKQLPCEQLWPRYEIAKTRAEKLLERQEKNGTPEGNPSTLVHSLVESIRSARLRFKA